MVLPKVVRCIPYIWQIYSLDCQMYSLQMADLVPTWTVSHLIWEISRLRWCLLLADFSLDLWLSVLGMDLAAKTPWSRDCREDTR